MRAEVAFSNAEPLSCKQRLHSRMQNLCDVSRRLILKCRSFVMRIEAVFSNAEPL